MRRVHIIVKGKVQGVFFRHHTEKEALKLGLKGYVKNLDDGTVEVVAEGPEKQIERLIVFCRVGPPASEVEDIIVTKIPINEKFSTFSARYYRGFL